MMIDWTKQDRGGSKCHGETRRQAVSQHWSISKPRECPALTTHHPGTAPPNADNVLDHSVSRLTSVFAMSWLMGLTMQLPYISTCHSPFNQIEVIIHIKHLSWTILFFVLDNKLLSQSSRHTSLHRRKNRFRNFLLCAFQSVTARKIDYCVSTVAAVHTRSALRNSGHELSP